MLRTFLLALASVLACGASAQDYPSRPIRLIVPFAPGGGTDILIRILAPKLGAALGQQLVVENRPGASSIIGTELVARSAPDGYTLLAVDTSFTVNPSLQPKLPYDSLKDLAPVIHLAAAPVILVLHPSVPAQSVKQLVALAKSKPGALAYASGGNGASTHLAGELFKMVAGVDIVHIPYKGTGPAIADVVASCAGLHALGVDRIVVSPIAVGGGAARTEHGTIPVPVPAVLRLLSAARAPTSGAAAASGVASRTTRSPAPSQAR